MEKVEKSAGLTVYSRDACHLCQQMIDALQQQQGQKAFDFNVIDIDSDPVLAARFNDKVPVLMALPDETEICHHFLDVAALDDYLAKIR